MFAAVMLYIAVLVIFLEKDIPYAAHREFLLGNPLLLLIGMTLTAGAAAIFGGNARAEAFLRIHSRRALLGISLILFILQVYVCYNAYFETGWDVGLVMIPNARMIAEGRLADLSNEYFSTYPNNVLLLFLFSVIMKADLMAGMLAALFDITGHKSLAYDTLFRFFRSGVSHTDSVAVSVRTKRQASPMEMGSHGAGRLLGVSLEASGASGVSCHSDGGGHCTV